MQVSYYKATPETASRLTLYRLFGCLQIVHIAHTRPEGKSEDFCQKELCQRMWDNRVYGRRGGWMQVTLLCHDGLVKVFRNLQPMEDNYF